MKQLLIIAILSFFVAGCSKDNDGNNNSPATLTNSQWKSLEDVLFMDIYYRKHAGFIAEFDDNNFHISYFDKKLHEDDLFITLINKGTYSYKNSKLRLTTAQGVQIQYKVSNDKMELVGDTKDFSTEYGIKYPQFMYLSLDGNKDSGDVIEGKTWKLSYIALQGTDTQYNFWDNHEDYNKSIYALSQADNFTVSFTGKGWANNTNKGDFTGKAINSIINGTWVANEITENISISLNNYPTIETDILAKAFITGLSNMFKFEGDGNILKLHFEYDSQIMYMALELHKTK